MISVGPHRLLGLSYDAMCEMGRGGGRVHEVFNLQLACKSVNFNESECGGNAFLEKYKWKLAV